MRARKAKQRVADVDVKNTSAAYWEQILKNEGLGMDAGRDPGHRKLLRVGGTEDLEAIYAAQITDFGKVKPQGNGSDDSGSE
jgi:hypothetical protein